LKTDMAGRAIKELEAGGRVLVTRLQYLGDVILTLPLVQLLSQRFPLAQIDYLAREAAADVLCGEPLFSRVWRLPDKSDGYGTVYRFFRELRGRRYSLAIDLYSNPRSALTTRLSGASMRIGGSRRMRKHLYTHPTVVAKTVRAATEFHIEHLTHLGIKGQPGKPSLTISELERDRARATLKKHGVNVDMPVIGIHPGGKWEVKRWPVKHFASLAGRLIEVFGMQIVAMCGAGEEAHREVLREVVGSRAVYLPTLPIRETAAIIAELDAMVVNDGGIMHVSVAVDTPTVGIFGSAEPDIWFPYEDFGPYQAAYTPIACRPCHSHVCGHLSCLWTLTPDMVEKKLLAVMESNKTRSTNPATS